VSVIHVPKQDDISHICTLDTSDLDVKENDDIKTLSEGVVSDIIEDRRYGDARTSPNYGSSKSARIQQISTNLDTDSKKVIECIKRISEAQEMAADSKVIARMYKQQSQSRGDALVVVSYQYKHNNCAAVLKIPYKKEVYQTGDNNITQAQRIIEKSVDKSLIYPSIEPSSGKVDKKCIKCYQTNESAYWQDFAGLKPSFTADEQLFEEVASGEEPFISCKEIRDLQDRRDEIDSDLLDGKINVSIGEFEFRTKLRNIIDPEQFSIEDNLDSTKVVLKGQDVKVVTKQGQNELSIFVKDQ